MVKQIVRDIFFLGQPSKPATKADIQIGKDLQDTLQANREWCVGMAANMICLLYTSPSPRDPKTSRMPSSA